MLVLNPRTKRYVNRTGAIGAAVLAAAAEIERMRLSPDVYLDRNALNAIADKCDSPTRRSLRQVDREFAATVRVAPSRGRRNAAYLEAFLRADFAPATLQLCCSAWHTRLHIDVLVDVHGGSKQILFRRHRSNEMPDVVGRFRYTASDDVRGIRLSDVLQKRPRKFVSDLLCGMTRVYATERPASRALLTAWNSFLLSTPQ